MNFAKKAAVILGDQFDIEIIEKHHNKKIDAPSGTALMIADGICEVLTVPCIMNMTDILSAKNVIKMKLVYMQSEAGGTIVGEHEVLFAGHHETLSLTHVAQSKEVFATGSINAAMFLAGKPAGLYDMSDLINE